MECELIGGPEDGKIVDHIGPRYIIAKPAEPWKMYEAKSTPTEPLKIKEIIYYLMDGTTRANRYRYCFEDYRWEFL